MMPLGPFSSKSFATSISPWIVTAEALEPFACAAISKEALPHLQDSKPSPLYDIKCQVELITSNQAQNVCNTNVNVLHWSFRDILVHQTANGCPVKTGDLLAGGTTSGSTPESLACLLELTQNGKNPLQLANGQSRGYLHDSDGVRLLAWSGELGSDNAVGFGQCVGHILP